MAKKTDSEQRELFMRATTNLATATDLLREAERMNWENKPDKARTLIKASQILVETASEELKEEVEE